MKKTEWVAVLVIALLLVFMLTGYSTVWGVGKDISDTAQWTHDKMTTPAKTETAKQEPAAK